MTSTALPNHRNQRDRIVAVLLQALGAWVCGRELAAISLQYNARVFEARHYLLLNIENKTEITEDGTRLSWFRLRFGADFTKQTAIARDSATESGRLFPDDGSHRHLDLG